MSPWSAPKHCPRCGTHPPGVTRCPKTAREYDKQRGTPTERGYDADWRKLRASWLREHPLCEPCQKRGLVVPASHVDHVQSIREAPERRLDPTNLRSCCASCHMSKTASQDGGFGNPRRK
jgi:5-methylcytosine-specific restriction enzyme A